MGDYRKLVAWQQAHDLSVRRYAAVTVRRARIAPGLRGQILRAVDSIASNLVEGCAKRSRSELAGFADSAYASAKEVENHLLKARDARVISPNEYDDFDRQVDRVARFCFVLIRVPAADDDVLEVAASENISNTSECH